MAKSKLPVQGKDVSERLMNTAAAPGVPTIRRGFDEDLLLIPDEALGADMTGEAAVFDFNHTHPDLYELEVVEEDLIRRYNASKAQDEYLEKERDSIPQKISTVRRINPGTEDDDQLPESKRPGGEGEPRTPYALRLPQALQALADRRGKDGLLEVLAWGAAQYDVPGDGMSMVGGFIPGDGHLSHSRRDTPKPVGRRSLKRRNNRTICQSLSLRRKKTSDFPNTHGRVIRMSAQELSTNK